MGTFLQILTTPVINEKLVLKENSFLVEKLKKNFRFNKHSVKGDIDTNFIIDNIVKYLEVGLKHMQIDLEVRNVLYQSLNLICFFVESYEEDDLRTIVHIQNYIFDSSLGRILIDNVGNPAAYSDPLLICEQLRLISALTLNYNSNIQQRICQQFCQDSNIEVLVHYIYQVIE